MRYGIFGGAFNPIHVGHVIIAIRSMEYLKLEKLFIVPTYIPPHRSSDLAPFDLRMRWIEKAFEGIEGIEISDYEFKKGGKSYSIETVEHFSNLLGEKPFFIIGEDWIGRIDTWYRFEDLRKMTTFAVYPRFRESVMDRFRDVYPDFVFMEKLPLVEVSSTEIRDRISKGLSVKGMVPDSIEKEVVSHYGVIT